MDERLNGSGLLGWDVVLFARVGDLVILKEASYDVDIRVSVKGGEGGTSLEHHALFGQFVLQRCLLFVIGSLHFELQNGSALVQSVDSVASYHEHFLLAGDANTVVHADLLALLQFPNLLLLSHEVEFHHLLALAHEVVHAFISRRQIVIHPHLHSTRLLLLL